MWRALSWSTWVCRLLSLNLLYLMPVFVGVRVGFDPMDYSVDESAGSINLTIRILEGTLERPVTVSFSTMDGTATSTAPSNDFVAVANQDVVFDPSTDSRNVAVTIVEDNRAEVTENFYGNLSTSDGSVQLSPDSARVDILESSRVDSKFII